MVIKISGLISRQGLTSENANLLVQKALNTVVLDFSRNWNQVIDRDLKKTRNTYRNAIVLNERPFVTEFVLTGSLPNMIEQGASPFDMKIGLLKSSRAKIGKNGKRYINVPFRFVRSGSLGEGVQFAGVIPSHLQEKVDALKNKQALKASQLGKSNVLLKRKEITTPSTLSEEQKAEYTHKAPIFQGLIKQSTVIGRAKTSKFMTFRRVSENSDVNSWIHKGIKPYNLIDKALSITNVQGIVEKTEREFMKSILGE